MSLDGVLTNNELQAWHWSDLQRRYPPYLTLYAAHLAKCETENLLKRCFEHFVVKGGPFPPEDSPGLLPGNADDLDVEEKGIVRNLRAKVMARR